MLKKYSIRIPSDIKYVYVKSKNILFLINSKGVTKLCRFKLFLDTNLDYISITNKFFQKCSKKELKKMKAYRGLELSLIKQELSQLSLTNYKQISLVGVGYRAFISSKLNVLILKLGYSHEIFIKIPTNLSVSCPKPNTIFVSGHSLNDINLFVNVIRSFRKPEPYKGKGVLFEYEHIVLKEGKSSK